MKTKKLINQSITLVLASLLLLVVGVRSWGVDKDSFNQVITHVESGCINDLTTSSEGYPLDQNESKISALELDAVITPVISFDFSHYLYLFSQFPFCISEEFVSIATRFVDSDLHIYSFLRFFATYIVTNAP